MNEYISTLNALAEQVGAKQVLLVEGQALYDGSWRLSCANFDDNDFPFSDIVVVGRGMNELPEGWNQLMKRMESKWK